MSSVLSSSAAVSKCKHSSRASAVIEPATPPVVGSPVDTAVGPVPPAKKCAWVSARTHVVSDVSVKSPPTVPAPGGPVFEALPAVSVTHPRGTASRTLQTHLSYGELSGDQVASVVGPSSAFVGDVVDASSAASIKSTVDALDSSAESGSETRSVDANLSECESELSEQSSGDASVSPVPEVQPVAVLEPPSPVPVKSSRRANRSATRLTRSSSRRLRVPSVEPSMFTQVPPPASPDPHQVYLEDINAFPPPRSGKGKSRGSKVNSAKGKGAAQAVTLGAALDLRALAVASISTPTPNKMLKLLGSVKGTVGSPVSSASKGKAKQPIPPTAPSSSGMAASTQALLSSLDALISNGCVSSESESESDREDHPVPTPSTVASASVPTVDLTVPVEVALRVMLPELQEDQLRSFYASLPPLGKFRPFLPSGRDADSFEHPPYLTLDVAIDLFHKDTVRSVLACIMFLGGLPYCSLSTMPYPTFSHDGRKVMAGGHAVVGLIPGTVTESFLYDIIEDGSHTYRRLRVLPFSQPWHCESTMLGLATGLDVVLSTCINSLGVEFTTHRFVHDVSNCNLYPSPATWSAPAAPASPATGSGSLWPKSPSKPASLASRSKTEYYQSLGYEDTIPVFDGRSSKGRHFLFQPEDFDSIASLPQYTASHELSRFTMVAVGYTPGIWLMFAQECHMSLNVQFIIVLGQSPSAAKLVSRGYGI